MLKSSIFKGHIKDLKDFATYAWRVLRSGRLRDDRANAAPSAMPPRSRILIVEFQLLAPDTNAGDRNVLDFIETLRADGHHITFWPMVTPYKPSDLQRLLKLGVDVVLPERRPPFPLWVRRNRDRLNMVLVCRPYVAERYLRTARKFRAPLVYYGHDLHCARLDMQARVLGDSAVAAQAVQMEALERSIMGIADLSLYPSEEEVDHIKVNYGIRTVRKVLIYSFDDFARRQVRPVGDQILFVGGFRHQPNVDAAKTLANEIFPIIKRARPNARLLIIGAHATDEIRGLASDFVSVRSNIPADELLQAYRESAMSLIPLRIGAGVKLKVVESLVQGVPAVTTSVGLQGLPGLEAVIGRHDSVDQLTQAAIDLLALNETAWLDLSARCSAYARSEFSRASMKASLDGAFASARRIYEGEDV